MHDQPQQMSRTLADTQAPLLYSLRYAAPEVIAEVTKRSRSIEASDKVDIWALGVIAFGALHSLHMDRSRAPM